MEKNVYHVQLEIDQKDVSRCYKQTNGLCFQYNYARMEAYSKKVHHHLLYLPYPTDCAT